MQNLIGEKLASYNPEVGYGDAVVGNFLPTSGERGSEAIARGLERAELIKEKKKQMDVDTLKNIQYDNHYYKMNDYFANQRNGIQDYITNKIKTSKPGELAHDYHLMKMVNDYNKQATASKDFEARTQDSLKSIDSLPDYFNKTALKKDVLLSLDDVKSPDDWNKWNAPAINPRHTFIDKYTDSLVKDLKPEERSVTVKNNFGIPGMHGVETKNIKALAFDENGKPGFTKKAASDIFFQDPHINSLVESNAKSIILNRYKDEYNALVAQGYDPEDAANRVWYQPTKDGNRVDDVKGDIAKNYLDKRLGTQEQSVPHLSNVPQPRPDAGTDVTKKQYLFQPGIATNQDKLTKFETGNIGVALKDKLGGGIDISSAPNGYYDSKGGFVENADRVNIEANHAGIILKKKDNGNLFTKVNKDGKFDYDKLLHFLKTAPKKEIENLELGYGVSGSIEDKKSVIGDSDTNSGGGKYTKSVKRSVIIPYDENSDINAQLQQAYQVSKNDANAVFDIESINPKAREIVDLYNKRIGESNHTENIESLRSKYNY